MASVFRKSLFLLAAVGVIGVSATSFGADTKSSATQEISHRYMVQGTGILCVKAPCPSYSALDILTSERHSLTNVSFVLLEDAPDGWKRFYKREVCLLVRGNIQDLIFKTLYVRAVLEVIETGSPNTATGDLFPEAEGCHF